MSLWAKSKQLPEVQALYGDHFPKEVRECLAEWLESNILFEFDEDNCKPKQYAASVLDAFLRELESKAHELNIRYLYLETKRKLQHAAEMFRHQCSNDPLSLMMILRHCLVTEQKLVEYTETASPGKSVEILQKLEHLMKQTEQTAEDLSLIKKQQEYFQSVLTDLQSEAPSQQHPVGDHSKSSEHSVNVKRAELLQMWSILVQKHQETLLEIESLQVRILEDELSVWKREQQLAANGFSIRSNLYSIQVWCEDLAKIIWLNRKQIQEAEILQTMPPFMDDKQPDQFHCMKLKTTQLITSLVKRSFVIEEQPPQVIERHISFTTKARLLVTSKLHLRPDPPRVTVSVISEAQANTLLKDDEILTEDASTNMFHNKSSMEYLNSRQLTASFKKMIIWKVNDKAEKPATQSEMNEKFALLFRSEVSLGSEELMVKLWSVSLPFVFILSRNQEPRAWAPVTWDNSFTEPGRMPFVVPDQVSLCRVVEMLSTKFRSETGRALTESNQQYLTSKALYDPNVQMPIVDPDGIMTLSYSKFCKEPLPGRNFTLWEWFYDLMKLVREHLRSPWIDSKIVGFIARQEVADLLQPCLPGTFMILFSDSALGAVEIAWVGGNTEVLMLPPLTCKDLATRPLADRVADLSDLAYLYPDVPKDQAFGEFYSRGTKLKKGSPPSLQTLDGAQLPRAGPSHDPSPDKGATSESNRTPKLSKKEMKRLRTKANNAKKKEEKANIAKKEEKGVDGRRQEFPDPYYTEPNGFQVNIGRPFKKLNV